MALAGTVTFMLTDVEGSTRLWQEDPDSMSGALVHLDAIVAGAADAHSGRLVKAKAEGDSSFAVFQSAADAVACAASVQLQLLSLPLDPPLRVRIAVHTADANTSEGDFAGLPVSRCARLRSCAHGGQVLISRATFELVRDSLPGGMTLKDLGPHRLKDLDRPEHVFQLCHPDLEETFPALLSLDHSRHNLPVQPTSLIGREEELAGLRRLLLEKGSRLVTLTGPGGVGKTRLALQAAADFVEEFEGGAWWVPLAAVTDADLVAPAIARPLGLPARQDPAAYLRDKRALLVLDNLEQIPEASPKLGDLLQWCPDLSILATSRHQLYVQGEQIFPVPPLTVEHAGRLFVERAQSVKPDFQLTDANASAVAEISRSLDGLPLAIELAAARVRLLPPQSMLGRMQNRLRLLTGGPKDQPERQQTLRNTIAWSHDLLGPTEQIAFRRLSVFVDGCTLQAAEAVCGDEGMDVLELVASLVEQSLVHLDENPQEETRFVMLQTVREFALECLEDSGEAESVRARHREWFLDLAETAEGKLSGGDQAVWLDRLERDHGNLRAALDSWASRDPRKQLKLATCLADFWDIRGHFTEARRRFADALKGLPDPSPLRTRGVRASGTLARLQGDISEARTLLEQALSEARRFDDKPVVADSLSELGSLSLSEGDYPAATKLHEEALAIRRGLGDERGIATSVGNIGWLALAQADYRHARDSFQEALTIARRLEDKLTAATSLMNLGAALQHLGDWAGRDRSWEQSLRLSREIGDKSGIARALGGLAIAALERGAYSVARCQAEENLVVRRDLVDRRGIAHALSLLGEIAARERDHTAALNMFEESYALLKELGERHLYPTLLIQLGGIALEDDNRERARGLYEKAKALAEELGNATIEGLALVALGMIAHDAGNQLEAQDHFEIALKGARDRGDVRLVCRCLCGLGSLLLDGGDIDGAEAHLDGAIATLMDADFREGVVLCLEGIADIHIARRDGAGAAVLLGSSRALSGKRLGPREQKLWDRRTSRLRELLDDERVGVELERGRQAGWEQALRIAQEGERRSLFHLEGDTFDIAFNGSSVKLRDSLGLRYLAILLAHPGSEIHCTDLATGRVESVGSGAAVDKDAYRRRLVQLQQAVQDARIAGDAEAEERARSEIADLAGELARAHGLRGQSRGAPDESERTRKAVTKCLRQALDKINDAHPDLWLHLKATVRTGTFCSYSPESPVSWKT